MTVLPPVVSLAPSAAPPMPLPSGEPFTRRDGIACFAIGVLLLLLATPVAVYRTALQGSSVNPDSLMRLVRLREMLEAGRMLDVVSRDGSGAGTVVPWSHLVDLLLLAMAAPLRLVVGWDRALGDVALVFGPISFGALCTATAWAMAPLTARPWRFLSPLLLVASPAILSYAMPGVVHHHVLLVLCAVMIAGCTGRVLALGRHARQLGLCCGIGLWISPEIMPFVLFAFAMLYLDRAWRGAPRSTAMRDAGAVMLGVVVAALLLDPPQAGLLVRATDRLSIPFVVMAASCCMSGWILCSDLSAARPGIAAVLATLPPLGWLVLFPAMAEGPAGLMSSDQAKAFFGSIEEMRPISSPQEALRLLWSGLMALVVALLAAYRGGPRSAWPWTVLLIAGCLALGWWHMRFAGYAGALGAMALPVAMTANLRSGRRLPSGLLFCAFIAGPALAGMMPQTTHRAPSPCPAPPSRALLAPASGEVVLASPNATPDLLYRSDVLTVGSLFHRGIAAFMRQRAAWRSPASEREPAAVAATGAGWVLACQGAGRDALVADLPTDTLEDALGSGRPPHWLNLSGLDHRWALWVVRNRADRP